MSEPVTNVEIEDVLSSIRKLVSDGDKARTREPVRHEPSAAQPDARKDGDPKQDRLVLTPAFLIVGDDDKPEAEASKGGDTPAKTAQDVVDPADDPVSFDEIVWEAVDDRDAEAAVSAHKPSAPPIDRTSLAATIAELEAAVSSDADEFEPDGSEVLSESVAWPERGMREIDDIEDADIADEDVARPEYKADPKKQSDASKNGTADVTDHGGDDTALAGDEEPVAFARRDTSFHTAPEDAPADVYKDDDLDDLMNAGGINLDEDALRALVSEVVKAELTGPLGERITRNVRKLVRREIYRILSSKEFD